MGNYSDINAIIVAAEGLSLCTIDDATTKQLNAWCYVHGCDFKYNNKAINNIKYKIDWLYEHFNNTDNNISSCCRRKRKKIRDARPINFDIDPYSDMYDKQDYDKIVAIHSKEKFWMQLRANNKPVFNSRVKMVQLLIKKCIEVNGGWLYLSDCEVTDADSLPKCYDIQINCEIFEEGMVEARNKIVEYTVDNSVYFDELGDINQLKKYGEANVHLTTSHVFAMHMITQQNMVVYLYDEENDGLISYFLYNSDFTENEVCGILHTTFYGTDRFDLICFDDNDIKYGHQMYVSAVNNGTNEKLSLFDIKNNKYYSNTYETHASTITLPTLNNNIYTRNDSQQSLSNTPMFHNNISSFTASNASDNTNTNGTNNYPTNSESILDENSYFHSSKTNTRKQRIYSNLSNNNRNNNGLDKLNTFVFQNNTQSGKRYERQDCADELRQMKPSKRRRK